LLTQSLFILLFRRRAHVFSWMKTIGGNIWNAFVVRISKMFTAKHSQKPSTQWLEKLFIVHIALQLMVLLKRAVL
jgi:hypothetical protein